MSYIIVSTWAPAYVMDLAHGEGKPAKGILLAGDYAAIFGTRNEARNAIERTLAWAEREVRSGRTGTSGKAFDWAQRRYYKIVPLRPPATVSAFIDANPERSRR